MDKNYKLVKTHIDDIDAGDAIMFDGKLRTVSLNNIKQDTLMGKTIFGDSFRLGRQPIYRAYWWDTLSNTPCK